MPGLIGHVQLFDVPKNCPPCHPVNGVVVSRHSSLVRDEVINAFQFCLGGGETGPWKGECRQEGQQASPKTGTEPGTPGDSGRHDEGNPKGMMMSARTRETVPLPARDEHARKDRYRCNKGGGFQDSK